MYVEQRPEGFLADREAVAVWLKRSPNTIRKHCVPVAHTATGRPLYSMEHCELILAGVQFRPAANRVHPVTRTTEQEAAC